MGTTVHMLALVQDDWVAGNAVPPDWPATLGLVGAALAGRVLIVDDVITAGTAVREAYQVSSAAGAQVVGLVILLDRQERGQNSLSTVQELKQALGIPVINIITLADLITTLEESNKYDNFLEPILNYRRKYGVIV